MTGEQVTIVGLKPLVRQMKTFDAEVAKEFKRTNMEAATLVMYEMLQRVPIGVEPDPHPGLLANTIRAGATPYTAYVSVGAAATPYTKPIVFGWGKRNIRPNPFPYKALDAKRAEIFAKFERDLSAVVERTFNSDGL